MENGLDFNKVAFALKDSADTLSVMDRMTIFNVLFYAYETGMFRDPAFVARYGTLTADHLRNSTNILTGN
jgi:hypothetical protein